MPNDFDDDLDIVDGVVADEAYVEKSESLVKANSTALAKEGPGTIDFNAIDLGLSSPAIVVAETGTKVSRFPIERIKFTTSKKERISVILDKVVIVKSHFAEDIGSVLCNGSLCCDHFGLPSVRYLFPVVHYENTDKKGTPLSSDIDVKVLAVGKDNYEELVTIMDNKGPLSQFDIVVTCNDEGYQKCSFTEAGDAKWKKSKKAQQYVADRLKKDGKNMVAAIGRIMTDAQLRKAIGADTAPGIQEDVNMDDIFKSDE